MGWTSLHRDKGLSNDEFFTHELLGDGLQLVASATIKSVYYAAVRESETDKVFGVVVLIKRAPRSDHNFFYKGMDETMGPGESEAPAAVLDALTETDSEWATEWRARCRENLARKAASAKVVPGTRVRFPRGLTFRFRGELVDAFEFTYEPDGRRRNIFRTAGLEENFRVTISDWQTAAYELV